MNFVEMMKQAGKLKKAMKDAQKKIKSITIEGESGGGMVRVAMRGNHEITGVHLDDNLLKEKKKLVEDLIKSAFNDAVNKLEAKLKENTNILNGIDIPPGIV